MNKLIIALSVACASACVFADTIVGATPKTTKADWFNATAGSTIEGGRFTSGTVTVEGGKYVIDSELAEPVRFEADTFTDGAKDMVEVAINLDTAIVPADVRNETLPTGAKVAFAASEDNDVRAYYAWVGGDWTQLSGATPSATDGTPYTLLVTFDNREETKRVQFKVGDTVLKANNNEWLPYSPVVSTAMSIDLVGSGNVAFLVGKQVTVTAEIIVVDGGTIDIKEEDMAAFKKAKPKKYETVDAFVADYASEAFGSDKFKTTGITVGAAYALGLVEKATDADGEKMIPKDDGELKAHAVAESTAEGIKIGLNVTPRTDTGATITFNVVDTTATEESVVKTVSAGNDIVIPTSALGMGLKKFTVRAVVTPAAK